MRKLAILGRCSRTCPHGSSSAVNSEIAGRYVFFCSAFQGGVYSGADGFNSATVFMTNNLKQAVLGWTQYMITKDSEFKRKAVRSNNSDYSLSEPWPVSHR